VGERERQTAAAAPVWLLGGSELKLSGGVVWRERNSSEKNRSLPSDPWEMALERDIWVPPYSKGLNRILFEWIL